MRLRTSGRLGPGDRRRDDHPRPADSRYLSVTGVGSRIVELLAEADHAGRAGRHDRRSSTRPTRRSSAPMPSASSASCGPPACSRTDDRAAGSAMPSGRAPQRVGPTGLPVLDPVDVYAGFPVRDAPRLRARVRGPDPRRPTGRRAARRAAAGPAAAAVPGRVLRRPRLLAAARGGRRPRRPGRAAAPVAYTLRYPGDPAADESDWQELVLGAPGGSAGWPWTGSGATYTTSWT